MVLFVYLLSNVLQRSTMHFAEMWLTNWFPIFALFSISHKCALRRNINTLSKRSQTDREHISFVCVKQLESCFIWHVQELSSHPFHRRSTQIITHIRYNWLFKHILQSENSWLTAGKWFCIYIFSARDLWGISFKFENRICLSSLRYDYEVSRSGLTERSVKFIPHTCKHK